MSESSSETQSPSRALAYLQLFRAPNMFTAVADVLAGYLITHGAIDTPGALALLVAASCLLYTAGMVLNDVFDLERDRRERPGRPLPSGRIDPSRARWLGYEMLAAGVGFGWLAGWLTGAIEPGVVASVLAAAVILYDGWLKRTPAGPLGMGTCRALNVLLDDLQRSFF